MTTPNVDAALASLLDDLCRRNDGRVRVEDIAGVVDNLLASIKREASAADIRLYSEIEGLHRFIQATRREVAALRPDEIKQRHLPAAADEMDAIVAATAAATHAILDATEAIEGAMGSVGPAAQDILAAATVRIYEACGFQDITGQRIGKVVKALKEIERKIDALILAFGDEIEKHKAERPEAKTKGKPPSDAALLHGPQLPGQANDQAAIDRLLASPD